MIRRTPELDAMELRARREHLGTVEESLAVYESMYEFARESGALDGLDPAFRLEEKMRFALALSGQRVDRQGRRRA